MITNLYCFTGCWSSTLPRTLGKLNYYEKLLSATYNKRDMPAYLCQERDSYIQKIRWIAKIPLFSYEMLRFSLLFSMRFLHLQYQFCANHIISQNWKCCCFIAWTAKERAQTTQVGCLCLSQSFFAWIICKNITEIGAPKASAQGIQEIDLAGQQIAWINQALLTLWYSLLQLADFCWER